MFSSIINIVLSVTFFIIIVTTCFGEFTSAPASLYLFSPGELEYTDVLVRRVNDNLTLVCELRGDATNRTYVWNFMPVDLNSGNRSQPFAVDPQEPSQRSTLTKYELQLSDSGHYMCSAPPFSITKYILVQNTLVKHCARAALACGARCVLPAYVCDGRADCARAEDEAPALCGHRPCARADRLNCSDGRCVPSAACCAPRATRCVQPACCAQHPRYAPLDGYEPEYPPLFEDRHAAADDYGFIQSTIYTVTACALIFMIAVVLLVSAVCKMHMKRAALRGPRVPPHYQLQYAQAPRFPPCYEASRLLPDTHASPPLSPHESPARGAPQCAGAAAEPPPCAEGFGLTRLSSIFSSRYQQVPTQCCDVEMTAVRSTSLNNSPTRNPPRLDNCRSPTYCDLNTEFYFTNQEASECGRDLNNMATPVEFFRRRAMRRNTLERVMDQLGERQRPFTLQLGRFQLSIPKFGRRASSERRPDTPNVAEINIDDLDFVRLNGNDTYTLNGRTIRLLGANFENYPVLPDSTVRPPPYTEAMRFKLYGPPPEYLSRDGLNNVNGNNVTVNNDIADEEARNNIEMPPNYDELASGVDANANVSANSIDSQTASTSNAQVPTNVETLNSVIDNLPAIDSDVNANDTEGSDGNNVIHNITSDVNNGHNVAVNVINVGKNGNE